jgi:ASC-1-like (ASCH) protein
MDKIVQAVQEGVSMNTVQNEVRNFLGAYRNYTPAVTKTDLVELNSKYTGMLDAFEKSFENGGTLCKMFKGGSAAKVREAKDIWASIYSLLEDIRDQQFQLISALVKVVRSKLDQSAAQQIAPRVDYVIYKFEALVRRMLAVRVAAQHVCDTFQYMNNDAPHPSCKSISSTVFLDERIITAMESIEQNLRTEVTTYETRTSTRYALIPVSQNFKNYSIHWEDLIAGGIIEFSLPANNVSFLTANGWINPLFPNEANQMALLKSMEIFIPNILGNTDPIGVEFSIKANQENAVVIAKADAQHYTVRSSEPISTTSKYSINTQCVNEERADFFSDKNSKYCIESNGRFGDTKRLPLPVSMYSKFHIKLEHGYNQATREVLKIYKPVGDTLKLRARLQVYSNPGAAKRRTHITPPDNTYCGEGKYREIVNGRAECKPCPPGSVPVGRGSYCISQEDAKKIAELTGKPLA